MNILTENYKLYNGDCLEKLKLIKDKSIDLVLIDPPYNIGKDKWDKWKTINAYVEFMGKVFLECQRVLKDNGSFYFFHNDFLQIVELQNWINKNTNFVFRNIITWDKLTNSDRVQFSNLLKMYGSQRSYFKGLTEYCLFYTFQDETGLKTIDNDLELYKPIRDYFKNERDKTKLTYKELNELMGVASNGGGMASNILTSYKKGWTFPTKEKYELLQKTGICQKEYEELRKEYEELRKEYEELRKEYEELRYTFNQPNICLKGNNFDELKNILRPYTTIYNYSRPKEDYRLGHITPKPIDMLEHIIKISSNEKDVVLDCFMGSGSTGVACLNTNRKFVGIELEEKYFNISVNRIFENYNSVK